MKSIRLTCALLALWWPCVAHAAAQEIAATVALSEAPTIDGPPAPEPPALISRDAVGRATVRAVRLVEGLQFDGKLDEPVYQSAPPLSDFIQQLPTPGAPATERTEAWVLFDANAIYISARCWDSADPSDWVAHELRRDAFIRQNDTFGVMLDTFYDRRNGAIFTTTPIGTLVDFFVTDEASLNGDWNPIWDVRVARFEGGWGVEMMLPFKSLRYRTGTGQLWGIQLVRSVTRKNEWTYLTPVPANGTGITRVSSGATLVGLELPPGSKNFEVKPYGTSRWMTSRASAGPSDDLTGDVGFDVKYGLSSNLTADLTYNTDFAQVEVDEQQVNLTRFSIQFPEKREFFLEGRGLFDFGRGGGAAGGGDAPLVFFSRRIGLEAGRAVPIIGGGRVTGKVGDFGVAFLNIQTDDEVRSGTEKTNFTVVRVKRDILRRSSIGGMFTNRSVAVSGNGTNQAYGLDASFSLSQDVYLSGYAAKTRTPGVVGDDASYRMRFDYNADRYGVQADHMLVGEHFNPEVGFVRRSDFRRSFAGLRFSPRPKSLKAVRQFTWEGTLDYTADGAGALESREQLARFATEFANSDKVTIEASNQFERIDVPFRAAGVLINPGHYPARDMSLSYALGRQRFLSGTGNFRRGEFYDGTITAYGFSGLFGFSPHLLVEPSVSFNQIELPSAAVTTRLIRTRFTYAFTARMFASAFPQYDSASRTVSNNFRFRWEYHPGSELFVVYTDENDTTGRGFPTLSNRTFAVKINRLFRF